MVNQTRQHEGSFTFNLDFYDEYIFRMVKNEIKNLNQLNDYKVLTGQSKTIRSS